MGRKQKYIEMFGSFTEPFSCKHQVFLFITAQQIIASGQHLNYAIINVLYTKADETYYRD